MYVDGMKCCDVYYVSILLLCSTGNALLVFRNTNTIDTQTYSYKYLAHTEISTSAYERTGRRCCRRRRVSYVVLCDHRRVSVCAVTRIVWCGNQQIARRCSSPGHDNRNKRGRTSGYVVCVCVFVHVCVARRRLFAMINLLRYKICSLCGCVRVCELVARIGD